MDRKRECPLCRLRQSLEHWRPAGLEFGDGEEPSAAGAEGAAPHQRQTSACVPLFCWGLTLNYKVLYTACRLACAFTDRAQVAAESLAQARRQTREFMGC